MPTFFSRSLVAVAALGIMSTVATSARAQTAFAIANGGTSLISFSITNPAAATLVGNFSSSDTNFAAGLPALDSIDFRPSTGELFGYNDFTDTVYRINTATGALTTVGGPLSTPTTSPTLDIDFNPRIDRFRIVNDANQNLVVNPNNGAFQQAGTGLQYAVGDPNESQFARINANAYNNNAVNAITPIPFDAPDTQYTIDFGLNQLSTLNNNGGQLTSIGTGLGVDVDQLYTGFDIFTSLTGVNSAYGLFSTDGGASTSIYTINLSTGAAVNPILLGGGFTGVYSLAITPVPAVAVVPEAGTLPLLMGGVMTAGLGIVVRRRIKK